MTVPDLTNRFGIPENAFGKQRELDKRMYEKDGDENTLFAVVDKERDEEERII